MRNLYKLLMKLAPTPPPSSFTSLILAKTSTCHKERRKTEESKEALPLADGGLGCGGGGGLEPILTTAKLRGCLYNSWSMINTYSNSVIINNYCKTDELVKIMLANRMDAGIAEYTRIWTYDLSFHSLSSAQGQRRVLPKTELPAPYPIFNAVHI